MLSATEAQTGLQPLCGQPKRPRRALWLGGQLPSTAVDPEPPLGREPYFPALLGRRHSRRSLRPGYRSNSGSSAGSPERGTSVWTGPQNNCRMETSEKARSELQVALLRRQKSIRVYRQPLTYSRSLNKQSRNFLGKSDLQPALSPVTPPGQESAIQEPGNPLILTVCRSNCDLQLMFFFCQFSAKNVQ